MKSKKLFTALFLLWGVPLILIFGGAAWVGHSGMIVVDVDGHGPGGNHVRVRVPAAMVHLALPFMPAVVCEDASGQIEKYAPIVKTLVGELERMEDGVIVEVTGRDMVRIEKKDRCMVVNVDSATERVHAVVPIGTVAAVLRKFEGMQACRVKIDSGGDSITL